MASLYQRKNDDTPTVGDIPEGFKVVITQYGPNFRCVDCDVTVDP